MTAAKKEKPVLSLRGALRERFAAPEWAYFEEVRNGTGWTRRVTRTADALAFGLWPSRGLELHGIEIKSARSDWKNELANPAKAEEIGRFCDRWWLVTEEKVAHLEEIPPAWGWMVFDGKKLKMWKDAPKREAQPIDRPMLAAILRKASESIDEVVEQRVWAEVSRQMENEREAHRHQEERMVAEKAEWAKKAHRYEHFLAPFARAFKFDWNAEALPEQLQAQLAGIDSAELDRLREGLAETARQLRNGTIQARAALRAAGVRPKKFPWERRRA